MIPSHHGKLFKGFFTRSLSIHPEEKKSNNKSNKNTFKSQIKIKSNNISPKNKPNFK